MCRKRLGPQGEVGDSVEIQRFLAVPTPIRGWDHVGTTGEVGDRITGAVVATTCRPIVVAEENNPGTGTT